MKAFSQLNPGLYYSFFVLGLTVFSGCYAPSQNFPVGSELWLKSNPEWVLASQAGGQTPKKVLVAVLDGGVDYNHPRLRGHLVPFAAPAESGRSYGIGLDLLGGELDFFPHYSVFDPESGQDGSEMLQMKEHGSHVSGLVTLSRPEIGLLPVRVLPLPEDKASRRTSESVLFDEEVKVAFFQDAVAHVGKGIRLACERGAKVLNLSLGIDFSKLKPEQQTLVRARLDSDLVHPIRNACAQSLLVVAAGNESREIDDTQYSLPVTLEEKNILGVGALKSKGKTAYYSNQGRFVDVYIRGTDIKSAVPESETSPAALERLSGTSMATPLVAHLAARILAIDSTLTPQQVRALILNTADLQELELERQPLPEGAPLEPGEALPLPEGMPAKRLGLVANFKKALESIKHLHEASVSERERERLKEKLFTPPFPHGHAPF